MNKWPKIAIIVFILLFVLSIMTSKTEEVVLEYGSGMGVNIIHDQKLFFIHSFQIELYNGTDQVISVYQPITKFSLVPGGDFPKSMDDVIAKENVEPGVQISGHKEKIWRLQRGFHFSSTIQYELDGKLETIQISEQLGAAAK